MHARSADKRGRQKARLATCKVENECNPETTAQYFQITVNILEAKKLKWPNPHSPNSYVMVVLGKKKHRTGIRRNMDEPHYREYFIFEVYTNVCDLQNCNLWMGVMEPRCCAPPRILGETTVNLGVIWSQPHHQVFHKWAQLSLPRKLASEPVGFLKVDISIIYRGDLKTVQEVTPTMICDGKIDENLLLPSGSEQQLANYLITIYGAFGLANSGHGVKLPSTFVRVSFCGLVAKTSVQYRSSNPIYNEQVSMVEMFPNLCENIRFEVCSTEGCFNRVVTSAHLNLEQISHDGENGFVPTFGPSLLHMYGTSYFGTVGSTSEDGPYHRGALLVSLKTIVPYYKQCLKSINVEPVTPIQVDDLWLQEDFCLLCPILEVSMLDRRITGNYCGLAITIGEIPYQNKPDEGLRKFHYTGSLHVIKTKPSYGYLDFPHAFPILQTAIRLPDFRFRMYRNNMVSGIIADLELVLSNVELLLKTFEYSSPNELIDKLNRAIDDAAGNILKFLDIMQYSSPDKSEHVLQQSSTELDQKQLELVKEEIGKIYQQIKTRAKSAPFSITLSFGNNCADSLKKSRKYLKLLLAETKSITQNLRNLIFKTDNGWSDIVVWLLSNGSRVAFTKISPADVIYSVIPEQNGSNCGKIQTIYLKPLKCSKHMNSAAGCVCIVAKVELILWMGLYRQKAAFENIVPGGYRLKTKDYSMCLQTSPMVIECRVFISRAKISCSVDMSTVKSPLIRINCLNAVKETKAKQKVSPPVWNQVLKIHKMIFMSPERLTMRPPTVLVELYDGDLSGKLMLIGRSEVQPTVEDRPSYEFAPKLQWCNIYKGTECTGQILMSAQLLQVPEKILKSTIYNPAEESFCASSDLRDVYECPTEDVEPLPAALIPDTTTYKVDVYWWGLRDINITRKPCVVLEIDELMIKSDIIIDKRVNGNFPNGRITQTFEAPLDSAYTPPFKVNLYDSSTFGRTMFLGSNDVTNPNKYFVNWIPKHEREDFLKSVSINSSDFFEVNHMLYLKKNDTYPLDDYYTNVNAPSKKNILQYKAKTSKWRRLFCRKEPDEEEYTLLPVFTKDKDQIKAVNDISKLSEHRDWWSRYHSSQECNNYEKDDIGDKITVYSSELELQSEFSKFKDWCSTLKVYQDKKTGIPEKDIQLQCGCLKAGIAIYKWPPPHNTIVVSSNGVNLQRGYFNDHPNNDSTKILVRLYVLKCCDLKLNDFVNNTDAYIVIKCGKKQFGDRDSYMPNTFNPIFGKLYEMRCSLPEDYLLSVSLFNHNTMSADELIGSTAIDLEDRFYTKHKACVGLSSVYNLTGPAKWRDCFKPSVILKELCSRNHIAAPEFPDANTVVVNGVEYRDSPRDKIYISTSERKESICLNLLRNWQTLPMCGYHLVPEHVETRTLRHPERPGLDQGKIQLWIDIFPLDAGLYIPPPVDVTPRKVEEYELRVIVWDVRNIKVYNHDWPTKKTLDIYVRAWIGNVDEAQSTDIHYQSPTGEGNFNWRMIFNFKYQHADNQLITLEKGTFTEVEERIPPTLIVQVMDSDAISPDDILGTLALNLNSMPHGVKLANQCTTEALEKSKLMNLFQIKFLRGWWPLKTFDLITGDNVPVGVIDLELTLLPKDKAILMPVGLGRESPSALQYPKRLKKSQRLTKGRHQTLIVTFISCCILLIVSLVVYVYREIPYF